MRKPSINGVTVEAPVRLGQVDFEQIRRLARESFGIDLKPGKEELVAARLAVLMRAGGFGSYGEFCRHVIADRSGEARAGMIDALATNHTSFLREPDHFDFLCGSAVPELLRGRDRIEVWCAACSTGEEVWSLICALNEVVGSSRVRVAASDISRKALAAAETASYASGRCTGLPAKWLDKYFDSPPVAAGPYRVKQQYRPQASFSRLNLMEPVSWARPFPVIFCRNVMIYFDAETQNRVAGLLAQWLEPGGYLFVGHAESLARCPHALEYVRPAVYRKPQKRGGSWSK